MSGAGTGPVVLASGALVRRLLHDIKQPLNLIRVVAQDVRLDARRDRLDLATVPESMQELEQAVDQVVAQLDRLRQLALLGQQEQPTGAALAPACAAALEQQKRQQPAPQLELDLAPELPAVALTSEELQQTLDQVLAQVSRSAAGQPAMVLRGRQRGAHVALWLETVGAAATGGDPGRGAVAQLGLEGGAAEPWLTLLLPAQQGDDGGGSEHVD